MSENEQESATSFFTRFRGYLLSPTIAFSLILVVVYAITCLLVDSFEPVTAALLNPSQPNSLIVLGLAQCQDPAPIIPTSLLTSMFLHASILHIVSNVLFLIFFGFILEEHFTKPKWIATFLITGLVGNITFAIAGVTGLLGPEGVCGVGASGAVYGIMGTALGWRATIVVIFLAGLDIFAGGGLFAHIGGLIAGFGIRHFWIIKKKEFD